MKFVIFHGSFGHPNEHWLPVIAEKLRGDGHKVHVPAFPCDEWDELTNRGEGALPEKQSLNIWLEVFDRNSKEILSGEPMVFIGHSLGPLFILHLIEKYKFVLDAGIFVSPFLGKLGKVWQADAVNGSFYNERFDFERIKQSVPVSYALFSDNDPYVESETSKKFARLVGSSVVKVKGAGHINNVGNASLIYELAKTSVPFAK